MQSLMQQTIMQQYEDEPTQVIPGETVAWELKKLKPMHLQVCALLAQGGKNIEVAAICGVTKEYVCMLLRQPLIKQEIARVAEITGARLELMFEKSVDVIADAMDKGTHSEKLKAARLHGELTKRIGRPDPFAVGQNVPDNRLEMLASRLEGLLSRTKTGLYDEAGNPIFEEAEVIRTIPHSGQSAGAE